MCVCMYVVMEDNEKETGTTKVCKPGRQLDALLLRLLEYCLDSVTVSLFSASEEVFALVTAQSKLVD